MDRDLEGKPAFDRARLVLFRAAIAHALHVEPHLRYQHVSAFVHDLSVPNTALTHPQPAPLLIRNPVVLWQVVSAVLAAALMIALIR